MSDDPLMPESTSPEALAKLNNSELAVIRTDLAQQRTALARARTGMSTRRTDMAETRTNLAENRTDLARERNRLAAERTLMAWIRTSLSLISFGFGIDRFFAYLKKTQANVSLDVLSEERILGLSFITLGTFSLMAATITHWQTLRNIEQRQATTVPSWSLGMIVAIVLVFIGLATYIPLLTGDVALRNILTLDSQIVRNLVSLTIFLIMLTMGINFSLRELLVFWQQVGLVLRAQLAASVLVPAVTLVLLWLLHPPNAVIVGLTLLAAAPGAPLLTKRVQMAGGSFNYGASLQVTLSLSVVLLTPIVLALFGLVFPGATETVDAWSVARQIAVVQFLPLTLGLLLRQIGAAIADEIRDFLTITADTLFVVLALFLLVLSLDLIPQLGMMPIALILVIATTALAIGHFLGGPAPETRAVVAIAGLARNAGLALFIAIRNQQTAAIPVILSYLILGALVAFPYSAWMKRQINTSTSEP